VGSHLAAAGPGAGLSKDVMLAAREGLRVKYVEVQSDADVYRVQVEALTELLANPGSFGYRFQTEAICL
jgi:hypothetical protein